ncbi:MAG: iron-containing alcohol dehydrogenase [Caldimicrobium sp.]|nr:iron-containing alcohol dehydrogenase [Caldimicrobium sp.]MCX7613365.1 iron-containing alcohol dehydrogenase [Caldimicrobium sp.]MDW8182156.1 iron-containing alcohol dehydrogenase [Caldimicrobium sp.]
MQDFEFYLPTKIIFGRDSLKRFPKEISSLGKKCLFLYGQGSIKRTGLYDRIVDILKNTSIQFEEFGGIKSNPTLVQVREAIQLARSLKPDFLLAVGGGSVIDVGKAVACGYYYQGNLWDLFERKLVPDKALPLAVISTIAGTGSEINNISVIVNELKRYKLSLRSPVLFPKFSFIDPSLTLTVPREYVAYGVMDAFSHLFEFFMFRDLRQNNVTEDLLVLFMKDLIKWGVRTVEEPTDYYARSQVHWISLLALSPLVRAGLGSYRFLLHSLEHPLSGGYPIAHGQGLATLVRAYLRINRAHEAVRSFFVRVLEVPLGPDLAKRGLKAYDSLLERLSLPKTLREVGLSEDVIHDLAEKAWEILHLWKAEKDINRESLVKIYLEAFGH